MSARCASPGCPNVPAKGRVFCYPCWLRVPGAPEPPPDPGLLQAVAALVFVVVFLVLLLGFVAAAAWLVRGLQ